MTVQSWMRNPWFSCVHRKDTTFFVSHKSPCLTFAGADAEMARKIWEAAAFSASGESIAALQDANGVDVETFSRIVKSMCENDVFRLSAEAGMPVGDATSSAQMEFPCERLLVCISGAIEASCIGQLLKVLRTHFCRDMRLVLTETASRLASSEGLGYLLDCPVHTDPLSREDVETGAPHIFLAQWASCVLVAPATAATIHRIAQGACNDLISSIVMATPSETPLVIAPSMNANMYGNAVLQRNLEACRECGYWVIEAGYGVEIAERVSEHALSLGGLGCTEYTILPILRNLMNVSRATVSQPRQF